MNKLKDLISLYEILRKNNISVTPNTWENLLVESLVYDNEFNNYELKELELRKKEVQRSYLEGSSNSLHFNLRPDLELLTQEIIQKMDTPEITRNKNILCNTLIIRIVENWEKFFWKDAKKIYPNINNNDFSTEETLNGIMHFLYLFLNKEPLKRFKMTRALIINNYLLNLIGFPGIIFSSKSKKRVLRSIDHYTDFKKEFLLTLEWECYKALYENNYPSEIISLDKLKELKKVTNLYVKPGTWWYWGDRRKYTFMKK
jgi:hypothetical protein